MPVESSAMADRELSARGEKRRSSKTSRRRKVLLSVLPLALVLVVVEIVLRSVYPLGVETPMGEGPWPWLIRHPVVGWTNRAHYRHDQFSINSQRLRGPEIETRKPSGTLRVVCLGDSRTFGLFLDLAGFRFDNDFARLLEFKLRPQ